jgi:hypothetical protein
MCAAESYPQIEESVRLLVLAVLSKKGARLPRGLSLAVHDALDKLCEECDLGAWEVRPAAPPRGWRRCCAASRSAWPNF